MTIYQNTFDTGEVCGTHSYHTSFQDAVAKLIDETGSGNYAPCVRKDYMATVRLDEVGGAVCVLDVTDGAYKAAQELIDEDARIASFEREHNDSLRQPSSIA